MYAFKPYLYLNRRPGQPYLLYVAVAVPENNQVSTPEALGVSDAGLRSFKIPVSKDHTVIPYAPSEFVIEVQEADIDPAMEIGIEVTVVNRDDDDKQLGVSAVRYDDADPQNGSGAPGDPGGGG